MGSMKTGFGSYAFRWSQVLSEGAFDVWKFIERSKDLGAETVQICDNLPLDNLSTGELKDLSNRLTELELVSEIGISGIEPGKLEKYIGICSQVGADILRAVLLDAEFEAGLKELKRILVSVIPELEKREVRIAIENHFHFTPGELLNLVEEINSPCIGICLDPFNSLAKFWGVEQTVKLLAPHAISVHVKDAVIERLETGFRISGCRQGEGMLDLTSMLKLIRQSGKAPNLYIESWMDRLEDPEMTIRKEEEWCGHAIQVLRTVLEELR